MQSHKTPLLLHVCCAPCSPYIIDLLSTHYDVTLYFYNPNIHPSEEYLLRVEETRRLADDLSLECIIGDDHTDLWFSLVKGLETEPEKGKRCEVCFHMRLKSAFDKARQLSIPLITTTLTVSPHKHAPTINFIGEQLEREYDGIRFLSENFKKHDGFRKTNEMGKKYNFYRQNYCGCVYSMRKQAT